MTRALLLALLPLAACSGDDATETPTDVTGTTKVETADTSFEVPELDLTGNSAHIVIGQNFGDVNGGSLRYAQAFILTDPAPALNLPGCIFQDHICTDSYPEVGNFVEPNVLPIAVSAGVSAGDDFVVGNTIVTLVTQITPNPYIGTPNTLNAAGNLTVDGDLAPFSSKDAFTFADPIVMTQPKDPEARIRINAGEAVDFAWKTGGDGDVFMEVGSHLGLQSSQFSFAPRNMRIYGLEDNGSYSFDPTTLPDLQVPVDSLTVNMMRMTQTAVDAAGNTFNIQARVEQTYKVDVISDKGWTELGDGSFIAGTCDEAKGLAAVSPGQYWGDVSSYDDDLEVAINANGQFETVGRDGFVKIILDEGDEVRLQSDQPETFAGLFVVGENCSDVLDRGYKEPTSTGFADPVDYIFEAPADGVYYIAIDSGIFVEGGGLFSLQIDLL